MEENLIKRRVATFLLYILCAATLALAQGSRAQSELTIRQLEQQFVDAALHNDWQFWDRTVAPDWTGIDPLGRQLDKPAALAIMKRTPNLSSRSAGLYDVQVRFIRDDVALATGTLAEAATVSGKRVSVKTRSTDILSYREGKWLVVASQVTAIK